MRTRPWIPPRLPLRAAGRQPPQVSSKASLRVESSAVAESPTETLPRASPVRVVRAKASSVPPANPSAAAMLMGMARALSQAQVKPQVATVGIRRATVTATHPVAATATANNLADEVKSGTRVNERKQKNMGALHLRCDRHHRCCAADGSQR